MPPVGGFIVSPRVIVNTKSCALSGPFPLRQGDPGDLRYQRDWQRGQQKLERADCTIRSTTPVHSALGQGSPSRP